MMIEFLVKPGKKSWEINEMLCSVYGDKTLKKTSIFKWIKHFNEGHENCNDDVRSGHSLTSVEDKNMDCVIEKTQKDLLCAI